MNRPIERIIVINKESMGYEKNADKKNSKGKSVYMNERMCQASNNKDE